MAWRIATEADLVEGARVRSSTNGIEGVVAGWIKRTCLVDYGVEHGALWQYSRGKIEMNFLEVWVEEE